MKTPNRPPIGQFVRNTYRRANLTTQHIKYNRLHTASFFV